MPEEKDRIMQRIGPRILESANLLVYTAIVLAIVVLANWFVSRHDHRWDLTPNQRYSLSPQTKKMLKGLDRDINIYVFDREQSFRDRRDLLGNYSAASHHLTVQYVDPDRQPSLARQLGVRTFGTIMVAAGDRHFEAQSPTEEAVTNALIRILKGQKSIYFVQGHGERDLESAERSGYDHVKKQIENGNYQVKTLVLLQKMEIPPDCALLVVAGPHTDYLAQEVETLKKYVQAGGRMLVMIDPTTELPELTKLFENWNVTVHNDLVIDLNPVAQVFGTEPTMPLIMKYGSSPIVQPLARMATLFPVTRSFAVGKDTKTSATVESLCNTSQESFGVADFDPKARQVSVAFREGKDYRGPLTVAVAGSLSGEGEKKTEGRFVAVGTSALAANAYLGFQGNRDLFLNMINWLSAEEDLISIRPKPPESQHLNLTEAQMRRVRILGVYGLPLLIIALGVSVWWGRR